MLDVVLAVLSVSVALGLRPWRSLGSEGPPWPWLAWWALLPLWWAADHYSGSPMVQPLSGVPLLVLMAGWPLAVLALVPTALLTGVLAGLDPTECLHRMVWLGSVPATLALAVGWAIRRWMPRHLFVYIFARAFFGTLLAMMGAGLLRLWLDGPPAALDTTSLLVGRWLSAWGDAFLTGMAAAIAVAFRPHWLATYSDRLYLPKDGGTSR